VKNSNGLVVLGLVVLVTAGLYVWSAGAKEQMPSLTALDYAQIEQLYAHYNHYIDSGTDEGRAFASLFTPDGVLHTGAPGLGEVRGTAALAELARTIGSPPPAVKASHYAANIMIDPSPEGATGSAYLVMMSSPREGTSVTGASLIYSDALVRAPDGWKFKARTVNQVTPASTSSSSGAKRVEWFARPAEMRIEPPAGAPSGPKERRAVQACPATLDEMCQKFWAFGGNFLTNNKIPARDRELLTLRTAYLIRGEYIWASHHDTYALKEGLTKEEVKRVTRGPEAEGWSEADQTLLRAADELHSGRFITDATWKALSRRYDDRELLDVVLTVANYTMLGMYYNSTGAQLEAGQTGFPD
jgi:4-carboxymuconolactone decarboxylase